MVTLKHAIPATVMIMTQNEEQHIEDAILSVQGFDQVIVVDSKSIDQTQSLSLKHGAEVVNFEWNGRYPKKRQWSLENCDIRHDWIIFLDADEHMTEGLMNEIEKLVSKPQEDCHSAYYVQGQPIWNGKKLKHGRWHKKIIVFKKGEVLYPDFADILAPDMGEIEGHYQPHVRGSIGTLKRHIVHDCARDIKAWRKKHQGYARWHAWMLKHHGAQKLSENSRGFRKFIKYLFYTLPLNAVVAWVDTIVLKRGFIDGYAGFSYGASRAWYYNEITKQRRQL